MKMSTPATFQQFLKWLGERFFRQPETEPPAPPAVRVRPPAQRPQPSRPTLVPLSPTVSGRVVDGGPGKNVLVRNKFVREETGTHDTLKILDESVAEPAEESGIDPYNTGRFDRAKSWETRFRK